MSGLILKDILNLRKMMKQLAGFIVIFAILGIMMDSPEYPTAMVIFLLPTMVLTTMSFDEYVKWEGYALGMPVSRKDIVLSKYIFLLAVSALAFGLSTVIAGVVSLKITVDVLEISMAMLLSLSFELFIYAVVLPLSFRFGVEKSRMWLLLAVGVPIAIGYLLSKYAASHADFAAMLPSEKDMERLIFLAPVAALMLVGLSCLISVRIYEKKEF